MRFQIGHTVGKYIQVARASRSSGQMQSASDVLPLGMWGEQNPIKAYLQTVGGEWDDPERERRPGMRSGHLGRSWLLTFFPNQTVANL